MDIFANPNESAAKQLLSASDLPVADITAQHMRHFFGCGSDSKLAGLVGLELYGDVALLRSLAVTVEMRGSGLGSKLVEYAEGFAREKGVTSLYLLTTTAEAFFQHRGYVRVPREEAPEAIKETTEFSGICPLSSAFMAKHFTGHPHRKVRMT